MKLGIKVLGLLLILLTGCSFNINDIQSIDISVYSDNDKNVSLAKDLIYYDPRYISFKVPSLNEETAKGIKLGYFIRSSDGQPSYRVTYNLTVLAVASNIDELKLQFEKFIPELASFHASKYDLFQELAPKGNSWVDSLFNSPVTETLKKSSKILQESVTEEQLTNILEKISNEYGQPKSIKYVRAQYYEEFENLPESVSLYYLQSYPDSKKLMIRVSLHQVNGKWLVMGINVQPHA